MKVSMSATFPGALECSAQLQRNEMEIRALTQSVEATAAYWGATQQFLLRQQHAVMATQHFQRCVQEQQVAQSRVTLDSSIPITSKTQQRQPSTSRKSATVLKLISALEPSPSDSDGSTMAGSSPAASIPPSPRTSISSISSIPDFEPPPGLTRVSNLTVSDPADQEPQTTLIIRNLPLTLTQDELTIFLDQQGFHGCYDFVYLPTDFGTTFSFGYAFANLVSFAEACRMVKQLDGLVGFEGHPDKACSVTWGTEMQGLEPHVERYRNSPLMHDSVPYGLKPAVFREGVRIPFPSPTKSIRKPRAPRVHRQQMRFAAMQA